MITRSVGSMRISSAATFSIASWLRAASNRHFALPASCRANSAPSPEDAPVMMAVQPSSEKTAEDEFGSMRREI